MTKKKPQRTMFKTCRKGHRYEVGEGCLFCRKLKGLNDGERKKPIQLTDREKEHAAKVSARLNKKAIQRAEMERKYPGYKG